MSCKNLTILKINNMKITGGKKSNLIGHTAFYINNKIWKVFTSILKVDKPILLLKYAKVDGQLAYYCLYLALFFQLLSNHNRPVTHFCVKIDQLRTADINYVNIINVHLCLCFDQQCKPHKRPVCGSNGKTYRNHCELHRDACLTGLKVQVAHHGHCEGKCVCRFSLQCLNSMIH